MSAMKNDMDKNEKMAPSAPREAETEKSTERSSGKNGKGLRWTAVDTTLLLLILLAIAGVVVRGVMDHRQKEKIPAEGPFYVDFKVEEIHSSVLDEIKSSDALYLYGTGELVGYVGFYDDGTRALHALPIVEADNDTSVAAEGCMVCLEGIYRNGSLLVTGMDRYLSPGSVLTLRTDRAVMTVEILNIRTAG